MVSAEYVELRAAVLRTQVTSTPADSLECLAALRALGPHLQGEPQRRSRLRAQWERAVLPRFLPPEVGPMPSTAKALGRWHQRLFRWLGRLDSEGNLVDTRGHRMALMRAPDVIPEFAHCPLADTE